MDSEITSGIKNVPFLPPSSPPPIELNLVPNEYDEYGDPDDIYDITGLSQKLNKKNENSSKLPLSSAKSSDIFDSDAQCYQKDLAKYEQKDNESQIEELKADNQGNINTRTPHDDSKLYSGMSPPPFNCIIPQTTQDDFDKNNFVGEIKEFNNSHTENKSSIYKKSDILSSTEKKSLDCSEYNENSHCTDSNYIHRDKLSLNSDVETISNIPIPNDKSDIQVTSKDKSLVLETSTIQEAKEKDTFLSDNNLKKIESLNLKCEISELDLKCNSESIQKTAISSNNRDNTKVPLEETNFVASEFAAFKSTSLPITENDVLQKELKDGLELNDSYSECCVQNLPKINSNFDSDDDFGDFISNDSFMSNFQSNILNKDNFSTLSIVEVKNDLPNQIESGNDDFGDFASNDDFKYAQESKNNQYPNQDISNYSISQEKSESDDDEFGEFAVSEFTDPIRNDKDSFIFNENSTQYSQAESEVQVHSDEESRNFSSSPSIALASDSKESNGDKDGEESTGVPISDEEFGEFNCPETSTRLQLEFSDDEEDNFVSGHFVDASDQKNKFQETLDENGAIDNKFKSLMLRWIPFINYNSSVENAASATVVKLNEVTEGDAFIWHHLEDIDSSLALKLSWPNSHINKLFLSSLNVDARNILFGHKWSSTIPVFAQTLSFSPLTPAKPSTSKQWNLDENIAVDSDPPPIVSVQEDRRTPAITDHSTDSNEKIIPPVHFDWSSSGLTNPLDTAVSFSSLFDYKLPNCEGGLEKSRVTSLEDEILQSLSPSDPPPGNEVKSRVASAPLLEKILKGSGQAPSQKTELASLSREVREFVQGLPDLNFMRSKVLMFPLHEGS